MVGDDDVSLLLPGREEDEEVRQKMQAEEVLSSICKLGITQLVLGVVLVAGGIGIACSYPFSSVDEAAEGIWCGAFVIVCGSLSVAARFHLYVALVTACFILNILTAVVVGSGVLISGISSFGNLWDSYRMGFAVAFIALNMGLTASLVLSIYLAVTFAKVLAQEKESYCCYGQQNPDASNLRMVYVPPGTHSFDPVGGAHVAVPGQPGAKAQPGLI